MTIKTILCHLPETLYVVMFYANTQCYHGTVGINNMPYHVTTLPREKGERI